MRAYTHYAARRSFHPEQRRVVIFAQGRTGSTLLEKLLCSTGHFRENGEILNTHTREIIWPLAYTLGDARRFGRENHVFHVKYYQLTRDRRHPLDVGAYLRALHGHGWSIIYLKRNNIAHHALSTFVSKARGGWHKFSDAPEHVRFTIDAERFHALMDERRGYQRSEAAALGALPHIELVYERDLERAERHQGVVDRICDALRLDRRPAHAPTFKVNRYSPADVIENYEDVREHFNGPATPPLQTNGAPSKGVGA